jgi:LmbE family N-acetylglucosaminyl deacetylase
MIESYMVGFNGINSETASTISGTIGAAALAILILRYRAYRRLVRFNTASDYAYDFSRSSGEELLVQIDSEGFTVPPHGTHDTGILELAVAVRASGMWADPSLELSIPGYRNRVFFERGAKGVRHVDVSRFLGLPGRVRMLGRRAGWKHQTARLRLWRNAPVHNERVLIIAPHPDDAEIAGYGLYAETRAHIATICAGNRCTWNLSQIEPKRERHPHLAARLRGWDSVRVPELARIPQEHTVQLAYPDDCLAQMFSKPRQDFCPPDYGFLEIRERGGFARSGTSCSWESLVGDLQQILIDVKPDVIVLPFPKYDNHADHGFSTVAVCQALETLSDKPGRFLLYINHCLLTEHWPFGPSGTLLSLPPNHDGKMPIHGIWSRPLSEEAQRDKLIALEAMHDLREGPSLGIPTWAEIFKDVRGNLATKFHGRERRPNNYFRRAVRASELFFVAQYDQLQLNTARFAAEFGPKNQ